MNDLKYIEEERDKLLEERGRIYQSVKDFTVSEEKTVSAIKKMKSINIKINNLNKKIDAQQKQKSGQ